MHASTEFVTTTEPSEADALATSDRADGTSLTTDPAEDELAEAGGGQPPAEVAGRRMIPVSELAAHPGNVRDDLGLTREFVASVTAEGVRIPLLITVGPDSRWRVIEGHRRLAAAIEAGLADVPCDVDLRRAGDDAGQYVDMLLANSDSYRANYTPGEEAAALFAAHEAGATRTRLRKATGRTAAQVKTALAAGSLPAETRARAAEACEQVSLDDMALLAEFDGDEDATSALLQAIEYGYPLEHTAQRIRHDKAEAAEHARIRGELEAAGVTVTGELPDDAAWLDDLTHDGEVLTAQSHAGCPGRGATFRSWNLLEPRYYCASPAEHGHESRWATARTDTGTGGSLSVSPGPVSGASGPAGSPPAPSGPDRRLVVAGNKAWEAAAVVRHRWITDSLLARRSAPREVHEFAARQLLAMPYPLADRLAGTRHRSLFTRLTGGRDAERLAEECGTATAGRLGILTLVPLIGAYEQAMTEGEGRSTWRTDRYSTCPRTDAGAYLTFLASLGYRLSDIERAVADGVPWTGITPLIDILGGTAEPSIEPELGPADMDADLGPAAGESGRPSEDAELEQDAEHHRATGACPELPEPSTTEADDTTEISSAAEAA